MQREQKNAEVRAQAKENGVYLWEVADRLGVAYSTMLCWLRRELSAEKKEAMQNAIAQIVVEREGAHA